MACDFYHWDKTKTCRHRKYRLCVTNLTAGLKKNRNVEWCFRIAPQSCIGLIFGPVVQITHDPPSTYCPNVKYFRPNIKYLLFTYNCYDLLANFNRTLTTQKQSSGTYVMPLGPTFWEIKILNGTSPCTLGELKLRILSSFTFKRIRRTSKSNLRYIT